MNIKPENFIITDFNSVFVAKNAKGNVIELKNRYCSCFIVTFSGSIRFSYEGGSIVADSGQPVFIPEGLAYKNECIEEAESLVFNFHTLNKYTAPAALSSVSHAFAKEKYEEIEKAHILNTDENKMTVLCALYSLASALFSQKVNNSSSDKIINKAKEYICLNYKLSSLTVSQVASECFISEIYL